MIRKLSFFLSNIKSVYNHNEFILGLFRARLKPALFDWFVNLNIFWWLENDKAESRNDKDE